MFIPNDHRDLQQRRFRFGMFIAVGFLILFTSNARAHAQLKVDRVTPLIIEAATTTEITLSGKFPDWPVQVWTDRDDIQISAHKTTGKLKVVGKTEVAPGPVWFRIYDSTTASPLQRIFVERIPVVTAKEPDNKSGEIPKTELPCVFSGTLEKGADVDSIRFHLESGSTLVAQVNAHRILRSPMDAVMQLCDIDGNVLFQSDDGRGLDPRIVFSIERTADYLLRIFAFPETPNSTIEFAGGSNFHYAITIGTGKTLEATYPLAVSTANERANDDLIPTGVGFEETDRAETLILTNRNSAIVFSKDAIGWDEVPLLEIPQLTEEKARQQKALSIPVSISGIIRAEGESDLYSIEMKKGESIHCTIRSRKIGWPLDAKLTISNSQGKELSTKDDLSRSDFDATIDFKAPADGTYQVAVSDAVGLASDRHWYDLTILRSQKSYSLKVASDQLTIEAGKTVEITVDIVREKGFESDVTLSAEQLPEGIQCKAVSAKGKTKGDDGEKVVTGIQKIALQFESKPSAQSGPIVIVAEANGVKKTLSVPFANGASQQLWLQVIPQKDSPESGQDKN